MTRLRGVLSKDIDPTVALRSVKFIAAQPGLAAATLQRVRRWIDGEAPEAGAKAFLALMQVDAESVVPVLLAEHDPEHDVMTVLRQGWLSVAQMAEHRTKVGMTMLAWLDAADNREDDRMTTLAVVSVLASVLRAKLDRSGCPVLTDTQRVSRYRLLAR
ncbi:hypothetical protein G3I59_06065 [Amycolatopsis rubida]|uniref:DUF2336 domain-containing protein n=1 Tax=Amycolatopsis rubida TaxID=112413 RepID=A0ABX0BNP0_9PSEU|nr:MULTISPECIES: hypothetical protein [Amycolatopsis]MYW90196.1 hypothetical protein [Amycolatopsis rubida]NEC55173.1 hypothetical protein [Amycolatopsis rubida]OAP28540.1 hypothetical protein A4R44_00330 [Amycolatopsis sp. M39]